MDAVDGEGTTDMIYQEEEENGCANDITCQYRGFEWYVSPLVFESRGLNVVVRKKRRDGETYVF